MNRIMFVLGIIIMFASALLFLFFSVIDNRAAGKASG
jgi:hypothetical protein